MPSSPMRLSRTLQQQTGAMGRAMCCRVPPIRLTEGRVLDRCVKHTEEPAHLSEDTLLCLRPSHSAVMPSVLNVPPSYSSTPQSWFLFKLREQT